ncbi:hypothetical protein DL770_008534 [Monosporascus sp. CRB-9-2]|nr:hypothetical protein DL770_008534 [Monosporascus sp. CRB-9-2]
MTTTALSLLIDNSSDYSGVTWTTPIPRLLRGDFVLGDKWSINHITVEDALSNRTGYPRHDLAVTGSSRDSVRNLGNLPMSTEPRARPTSGRGMRREAGFSPPTSTTTTTPPGGGGYVSILHAVASDMEDAGSITVSTVLDYAKYLLVMMTEAGPPSKVGHREAKAPRMLAALRPRSSV